MRTDTVVVGDRQVIVRSRNRKTAIIEAEYSKALHKVYPEAEVYEVAMLQVPMPLSKPPASKDESSSEAYSDPEMGAYLSATASARVRNPVGAEFSMAINLAVPIMARFISALGTPFGCEGDGRLNDMNVEIAFRDFLNDDEPDTGFWSECVKRINALDKPVTSITVAPPETLTEAQQADPLYVEPEPMSTTV